MSASSPQKAPNYASYREGLTAVDSGTITDRALGMNMAGYEFAHIQLETATGANPALQILYWSEAIGAFIREHTDLVFTAVGANKDWECTINCRGRIFFAFLTSITAGTVSMHVSGFNIPNP